MALPRTWKLWFRVRRLRTFATLTMLPLSAQVVGSGVGDLRLTCLVCMCHVSCSWCPGVTGQGIPSGATMSKVSEVLISGDEDLKQKKQVSRAFTLCLWASN